MDEFMATRDMLAECADMVLRVADSQEIPCVRFNMMAACDIVRFLIEDLGWDALPGDARGRKIVPIDAAIEPSCAILAVEVIHGIRAVSSLDKDETLMAIRGMDLLGCRACTPLLRARLWHWLRRAPLEELVPHIPALTVDEGVQTQLIRRLVVLKPFWHDFKIDVLQNVELDFDTAKVFLAHLVRFFPAAVVLDHVLHRLRQPTIANLLALCGEHGCYYHPGEVRDIMTSLQKTLSKTGGEEARGPLGLVKTVLGALGTYKTLPLSLCRAHGSVLLFDTTTSVLVKFDPDHTRPVYIRASNWLRLAVDKEAGTIDCSFVLGRMDDEGYATSVQVRLMCWTESAKQDGDGEESRGQECSEAWYTFRGVDRGAWTALSQHSAHTARGLDLPAALTDPRRMRLDFFFDVVNILDHPF